MKRIKLSYLFLLFPLFTGGVSLQGQQMSFLLTGSQETSLNQSTGSAGYASIEYNNSQISYEIHHTGTSGLTGSHFHGPAGPGTNAGVQIGISEGPSPMTGTTSTLSSAQESDFLSGDWYLNLHTNENSGGELRGQAVSQLSFEPNNIISGSQVTGGLSTAGGGAARITYNPDTMELGWDIAFEGLVSGVTAMHFHGPASLGDDAGVQVGISDLTSESSGFATLTSTQETDLLDGLWYLNIHTNDHGAGEIRGQIQTIATVPEPSAYAFMLGLAGLGLVIWRRRKIS